MTSPTPQIRAGETFHLFLGVEFVNLVREGEGESPNILISHPFGILLLVIAA